MCIIVAAEEGEGWVLPHLEYIDTAVIHITSIHIPLSRSSPMAPHNCMGAWKLGFYVPRKEIRTRFE